MTGSGSGVHRIAVISDTHGLIRPEAVPVLQSAERILHAGDIASRETLDRLGQLGEVTAVRGNCDGPWAEDIPWERVLDLYGHRVYMVHSIRTASSLGEGADITVFGHSHRYEETWADGVLRLNPGSAGPKRFGRPASMAVLELDGTGGIRVEKIELSAAGAPAPSRRPADLYQTIELVVRNLRKGRAPEFISGKYGIPPDLTAQICQIYYTHPGVDIQGILDRMETAALQDLPPASRGKAAPPYHVRT